MLHALIAYYEPLAVTRPAFLSHRHCWRSSWRTSSWLESLVSEAGQCREMQSLHCRVQREIDPSRQPTLERNFRLCRDRTDPPMIAASSWAEVLAVHLRWTKNCYYMKRVSENNEINLVDARLLHDYALTLQMAQSNGCPTNTKC